MSSPEPERTAGPPPGVKTPTGRELEVRETLQRYAKWLPEQRPLSVFVHLNPLYHCIEVVRAPLLGAAPTPGNYIAVVAVGALGWTATYVLFGRFRERIPYWS